MLFVDQRSQSRMETSEAVSVTILGASETKLLGRITNYSHHGMGLQISKPAPIGAAVKVEWSNVLLLGEVCHCQAVEEGFAIGLYLEHALYNTLELAELARRLLEESPAAETAERRVGERKA